MKNLKFKFEHFSGVKPNGWESEEDWPDNVCIEAPTRAEAIKLFKKKYGIDPLNISCKCCGTDYFIEVLE